MGDKNGWATTGEQFKADPATLRGYGENVAKLHQNFEQDTTGSGMNLGGIGQDWSISTGFYPPGTTCSQLADRNGADILSALQDCATNLISIPSAILTMADLVENVAAHGTAQVNAAEANAMEWAFVTPGADKPAGVPSYIKGTIQGNLAAAATTSGTEKPIPSLSGTQAGTSVQAYATADGGRRYVVESPNGRHTEWTEDKQGRKTYQLVRAADGSEITTSYSNGKPTGTTTTSVKSTTDNYVNGKLVAKVPSTQGSSGPVTMTEKSDVQSVTDSQSVTESRKVNGKVETTTEHVVVTKYTDGTESHRYYTETGSHISDDTTIGRQTPANTYADIADQAPKETAAARQGQLGGM
jgi:hypothetical protein